MTTKENTHPTAATVERAGTETAAGKQLFLCSIITRTRQTVNLGGDVMTDIFEEVKDRLTMQEVAQHYGFTPNQSGFVKCPFHTGDRTASLKVYPGGRGFHCFGCNRGGSVIDFAAELFGLTPLDAVRQLDRDFSLNLPLDRQQTPAERREAEQAAQRRRELADAAQLFEAWRSSMLDRLNACFRLAHMTMKAIETPADLDRLTDAQALAIQWQATFGYWADCLLSDDMEKQMDVFRDRKGVEARCNQILRSMQTKLGAA